MSQKRALISFLDYMLFTFINIACVPLGLLVYSYLSIFAPCLELSISIIVALICLHTSYLMYYPISSIHYIVYQVLEKFKRFQPYAFFRRASRFLIFPFRYRELSVRIFRTTTFQLFATCLIHYLLILLAVVAIL